MNPHQLYLVLTSSSTMMSNRENIYRFRHKTRQPGRQSRYPASLTPDVRDVDLASDGWRIIYYLLTALTLASIWAYNRGFRPVAAALCTARRRRAAHLRSPGNQDDHPGPTQVLTPGGAEKRATGGSKFVTAEASRRKNRTIRELRKSRSVRARRPTSRAFH